MDSYIVLYREAGDEHPANPPLLFHCQADDGDHAEEQCLTANPECTVAWVYRGIDWHEAFDDYYREQTDGAVDWSELAEHHSAQVVEG